MKHTLSFFIATGFTLFGVSPVLKGGICDGDFLCNLFLISIAYFPYFLALTVITYIVITFIVLTVFPRTTSFGNELIKSVFLPFTCSIFLSFILIFFYHNYFSVRIEKQGMINSFKKELNQLNYELYEPTYIPVGHNLFETRVDNGNLSFYYAGSDARRFVISEFTTPPYKALTPGYCNIDGGDFQLVDVSGSTASAVRGNCMEIKTPKGTSVYLMTFRIESEKKLAAIILGKTLITIYGFNFSNQELMDLIDGLEKKDASDINFKVADWQ